MQIGCPLMATVNELVGQKREAEVGWLPLLTHQHVDNPLFTLAEIRGGR